MLFDDNNYYNENNYSSNVWYWSKISHCCIYCILWLKIIDEVHVIKLSSYFKILLFGEWLCFHISVAQSGLFVKIKLNLSSIWVSIVLVFMLYIICDTFNLYYFKIVFLLCYTFCSQVSIRCLILVYQKPNVHLVHQVNWYITC